MPALNFQPRFADLVRSGKKRQTIRALRKDGRDPEPGDMLYLFTGMGTKKCCRLIPPQTCKSVHRVRITTSRGSVSRWCWFRVRTGGRFLNAREIDALAQADGFVNGLEMFAWFKQAHGMPFRGQLTKW